jgi:hypothetical protein
MVKTVFISYARGDDEPFVERLHSDLEARDFDIWWDRVAMSARGLTFLHEIREAIDSCERFILVLGPKSVMSEYVTAEWRHALTFGKPINPILRLGDFPLVPDGLKLLHIEDFRDDTSYVRHLENLVRQLSEPIAQMGKLIGVPSLPEHILNRPQRIQSLKDALLADLQRPVVVTGVATRVGVHGMGGIGKSVLANMLARDIEVRRAFPDGIIWVPFGTEPNLVDLQCSVVRIFTEICRIENVAQGRKELLELLASKAVLLVLDDVWERTHAEAFNVLGPRCRAVITTRDAGLVTSLGGTQHQVQLLTMVESLDLLASSAGKNADVLPPEAKEIVSECGYLPLALALCGSMVRRGIGWSGILNRLKQAALKSIADRQTENIQHRNLWTAMQVSVAALPPDEQQRFIELSIFPSDETIPESTVHTLWLHTGHLDEFGCEDLLISLSERSLIQLDTDTPCRKISLHDILHDFVTKLAGDPAPQNKKLIEAYRKHCFCGWATGPNDGYFLQHLFNHMVAAGLWEELTSLLLDPTWIDIKRRIGQIVNLLSDYDAALDLIEKFRADDYRKIELVRDSIPEEIISRVVHDLSMETSAKLGILDHDWSKVPTDLKASTRRSADNIRTKLAAIGLEYVPIKNAYLKSDEWVFTEFEIESMAKMEHIQWVEEKKRQGWSFAPMRNNVKKQHPIIIPWDAMTESEKNKDRVAVGFIGQFLKQSGFMICRKENS